MYTYTFDATKKDESPQQSTDQNRNSFSFDKMELASGGLVIYDHKYQSSKPKDEKLNKTAKIYQSTIN